MAEPLKNIYNEKFFEHFTKAFLKISPAFNEKLFLTKIYDEQWKERELKQRMRHISSVLHLTLACDYPTATNWITQLIDLLQDNSSEMAFEYMFLPDFIEQYGIDDYQTSVKAMEKITQFTSCEFAVRPFIIKYPEKMMQQMLDWTAHSHHGVRRLASEGCRPRLPWAMALPVFKNNPAPILPILELLKNDSSDFVRRSVANNINDIAKDHPELVVGLVKSWIGETAETDWIVKHGSRTLLKQGHPEIMHVFGFGSTANIEINNIEILTPSVQIGNKLSFTFELFNQNSSPAKIRLEYAIYYKKANGSLSKKVFKISEKVYEAETTTKIQREQSFKIITTRKFHLGIHQVAIIVNGVESNRHDFELID